MVCFITLRSFKTQTHITIKLAAWKRCNNVLHTTPTPSLHLIIL
jgi:hypothetical protein